jgi:hypothetical protein
LSTNSSDLMDLSRQRSIEDPHAEIQRQRNAISDGEHLLRGKMSAAKRGMIERAVASSKAKLEFAESLIGAASQAGAGAT